jgi:hypothetical protein
VAPAVSRLGPFRWRARIFGSLFGFGPLISGVSNAMAQSHGFVAEAVP